MIPYFIFNGINSKEYNIHIKSMPGINTLDDSVQYVEIPGRDGFLTIPLNRKPPINKKIDFTIFPDAFMHQIKKWLSGSGELILSNDRDVFYKAKIESIREFKGVDMEKVSSITFKCQPHGYLHSGKNLIKITEKNTKIMNPAEESKPLITVYGNGRIDLTVNENILQLDVNEHIVIDCELLESYKDNELISFVGNFPTFVSGENNITWDGAAEKIEVIPRWRT